MKFILKRKSKEYRLVSARGKPCFSISKGMKFALKRKKFLNALPCSYMMVLNTMVLIKKCFSVFLCFFVHLFIQFISSFSSSSSQILQRILQQEKISWFFTPSHPMNDFYKQFAINTYILFYCFYFGFLINIFFSFTILQTVKNCRIFTLTCELVNNLELL